MINMCKRTMLRRSISLVIHCCHQKDGVARERKVYGFSCIDLWSRRGCPFQMCSSWNQHTNTQIFIFFEEKLFSMSCYACLMMYVLTACPYRFSPGERGPLCMTVSWRQGADCEGRWRNQEWPLSYSLTSVWGQPAPRKCKLKWTLCHPAAIRVPLE